jgi:hypothetical protein
MLQIKEQIWDKWFCGLISYNNHTSQIEEQLHITENKTSKPVVKTFENEISALTLPWFALI